MAEHIFLRWFRKGGGVKVLGRFAPALRIEPHALPAICLSVFLTGHVRRLVSCRFQASPRQKWAEAVGLGLLWF
jgi:hypothetical protein